MTGMQLQAPGAGFGLNPMQKDHDGTWTILSCFRKIDNLSAVYYSTQFFICFHLSKSSKFTCVSFTFFRTIYISYIRSIKGKLIYREASLQNKQLDIDLILKEFIFLNYKQKKEFERKSWCYK